MKRETESAVQALRWCEVGDKALQGRYTCPGCLNGQCASPQACHLPEPAPDPVPRTNWRQLMTNPSFRVGAALAGGGVALFAFEGLCWLLNLT